MSCKKLANCLKLPEPLLKIFVSVDDLSGSTPAELPLYFTDDERGSRTAPQQEIDVRELLAFPFWQPGLTRDPAELPRVFWAAAARIFSLPLV